MERLLKRVVQLPVMSWSFPRWMRIAGGCVGLLLTLLGLASVPEDASTWASWLGGLDGDASRWLFVIIGVALVALALLARSNRKPDEPHLHDSDCGTAREHEQIESVDLDLVPLEPAVAGNDSRIFKLMVRITNRGSTGSFVARATSTVDGLTVTDYHPGNLAWKGILSAQVDIYGDGGIHDLVLMDVDYPRRRLRFAGPSSAYSGPDRQQRGMEVEPRGDRIAFELEIRDTRRDIGVRTRVEIQFDGESGYPSLKLVHR